MEQLIIPVLIFQCALALVFIAGIHVVLLAKPLRPKLPPKTLTGRDAVTETPEPKKMAHYGGLPYGLKRMGK